MTEAYDTYPEPPAEAQPLYTSYPVPTSFEAPPDVRNRTEVQRALSLEYPSLLRDARVGGTVLIRFHVDERGFVSETLVERSSGYAQLDVAAAPCRSTVRVHARRERRGGGSRLAPGAHQVPGGVTRRRVSPSTGRRGPPCPPVMPHEGPAAEG